MNYEQIYNIAISCKDVNDFRIMMSNAYISTHNNEKRFFNKTLSTIAHRYGLTLEDALSDRSDADHTNVRRIFCHIMNKYHNISQDGIAKYLGKHRTTIVYHCQKAQGFMEVDKQFRDEVEQFFFLKT